MGFDCTLGIMNHLGFHMLYAFSPVSNQLDLVLNDDVGHRHCRRSNASPLA